MKALIATARGFEESELLVPYYRLLEEGLEVDIAAPRRGTVPGKHSYPVVANRALDEVAAQDYELLVVPGGSAPQIVTSRRPADLPAFMRATLALLRARGRVDVDQAPGCAPV